MNNYNLFFLIIFGGLVSTAFISVMLWKPLHFILCKKYGTLLFRQPYFRPTEPGVYSAWPMSLFRSMGYVLLLAAPRLARWRRFKGGELDTADIMFLVFFCRVLIFLVLLGIIFCVTLMTWG